LSLTNKPLIADLKAEVAEGLRALDEGKSVPFDEETVGRIKRAGRAKFEAAIMNTVFLRLQLWYFGSLTFPAPYIQ
jgi:hypothetical protein